MTTYTAPFEAAVDHCMLYEVGGFWNVNNPAVPLGLIDTPQHRQAVGYVNDPDDRGGETKFGVAKNANADLNITNLTWDGAKAAYFIRYWIAAKCDQMSGRIGVLHFDSAVNHGINRANQFLQRAAGVAPDGSVGPVTLAKLRQLNDIAVCNSICNQRDQFYRSIVANNPAQGKYLAGWLRRINEMRDFTTNPARTFS